MKENYVICRDIPKGLEPGHFKKNNFNADHFKIIRIYGNRFGIESRMRAKGFRVVWVFTLENVISIKNSSLGEFLIKYKKLRKEHYEFVKTIIFDAHYETYSITNLPQINETQFDINKLSTN